MGRHALTVEELKAFRYPNLMSEVVETGYSLCTLSEHMGLGRCEENDSLILGKLAGKDMLNIDEVTGLCRLFDCDPEYLFSNELSLCCDFRSYAQVRHYEESEKKRKDFEVYNEIQWIGQELKKKPQLIQIIKKLLSVSEEQWNFVSEIKTA